MESIVASFLQDDAVPTIEGPGLGAIIVPVIIGVLFLIVGIASGWKVFAKAGEPGWAILVPIYNLLTFLKIGGKPGWWIVLYFVGLGPIIGILVNMEIAKKFGKGTGFGLGMAFIPFIFWPMLAFGDATYQG